jgi:hypothetical protein
MHLVKNTTNEKFLDKLDKKFVSPLLKLIEEAKKNSTTLLKSPYYLRMNDKSKILFATCLKQIVVPGKRKKDGFAAVPALRLQDYCEDIIANVELSEIQDAINIYKLQKKEVSLGSYAITPEVINCMLHKLFVDFLYVVLFDNKEIWGAIGKAQLSRSVFHDNFKADNNNLSTCPYCDLDTIISSGTHEVEHFLPKSKFPLLALYSKNLFSACLGCNKPGGKGARVSKNITSPYCREIGEEVAFNFLYLQKKIEIFSEPKNDDVVGYLELVNLPERYGKEHVWNFFDVRKKALFESIQKIHSLDRVELETYVKSQLDGVPLKYAMKYWVKDVPEYYDV